jgi:hypothetical protein
MMFITFKDLLGFAVTGFFVTIFFAAFGAFSLLVPLMMIVMGVAAVFCSRIE